MSNLHLYPGDSLAVLPRFPVNTFDALITDPPASIGFMGQVWDGDKGGRRQWVAWLSSIMGECLRVLKPGAHALVWAIPRRSHWTAWALEDAGFEIRDRLCVYFLSGFPKYLSVDKAIDKKLGAERQVIRTSKIRDIRSNNYAPGQEVKMFEYEHTAPSSPQAKQWEGWATHLKPAIEDWWLVRKPLSERTVADNVLRWGTGALNVGACRIPVYKPKNQTGGDNHSERGIHSVWKERFKGKALPHKKLSGWKDSGIRPTDPHPDSRYPSHLIVSDWELMGEHTGFFHPPIYAPKARRCRGEGNHHPTVKPVELMKYFCKLLTRPGGHVLDPFAGSFTTGVACQQLGLVFTGIEMKPDYFQIGLRRLGA